MEPPSPKKRSYGAEVSFSINGKKYTVGPEVPADLSLNTFIRDHANLKGTKVMCREGGCGACIVTVTATHPATRRPTTQAVNSCMVGVHSCHGWEITTVEGLGNKKTGYDRVVKRLAAANGSQCGYCSPGMVMNMHSLLEANPNITMKEVENSFGGNICRCTGYRPILDAFKSLASDAPEKLVAKLADIEDMICPTSGKICQQNGCSKTCTNGTNGITATVDNLEMHLSDGTLWYKLSSVKEIFNTLDKIGRKAYRFVAGNTGQGVYRIEGKEEVLIDITSIPELHDTAITEDGVILGANINLTDAMAFFNATAKRIPDRFSYLTTLAEHIDLIANVPVRNTGTIAGNLAMKHSHSEFPSDIFLMLEMVEAQLIIGDRYGEQKVNLQKYLATDMNKKIILKVVLPNIDSRKHVTRSYKIMPRAQNAHAYVNAGFNVCLSDPSTRNARVVKKPIILFGGINPQFLHAEKTETFLNGKVLYDNETLQGALKILESELKPDHVLPDPSPEFRKGLALSLFYKFVLSVLPTDLKDELRSGATLLERPVSSAFQDYNTNKDVWPLNKPVPKIEALMQCAGEAEYTNDIPTMPGELWAELVLTERANAKIAHIDASEALKMDGVVAFFTAKDLPGRNIFVMPPQLAIKEEEEIFVSETSHYAGQAAGVIVAENQTIGRRAARLVKISYTDIKPVQLDMKKIIAENSEERISQEMKVEAKEKGSEVKHVIKGTLELKGQYHYTMETMTCLSVPTENHMEVFAATQWPTGLQEALSQVLNLPQNCIDIRVRRLGGAYGSKINRANHAASVASAAAYLLQRPVRIALAMETNTEWMGKRCPLIFNYEVGVNDSGVIQYLDGAAYQDDGYCSNDSPMAFGATFHHAVSGYNSSTWNFTGYGVKTDTASNTWCRSPGSTEGICFIENVMEHISKVTGNHPVSVRKANMSKDHQALAELTDELRKLSDYDNRQKEIEQFNKVNRWKKRGISLVPMSYPVGYFGGHFGTVSIFALDGTVAITHGGIEMGQGLNTKAAQVAAHVLGVPLEKVTVKPTMTVTSPNNAPTGGSVGSESVCYAIKVCCEELKSRLKPIQEKLGDKAQWEDICKAAYKADINLNSSHMFTKHDGVQGYSVYGLVVTEVELDILTGQYHTTRVDLLEDAGESLSPEVDIGQIEGAFVMGLGYYTTEELVYAPDTGRLLSNRTWNYKPPGAKDIPIDFRIILRKNAPNNGGVLRSKATGEPPLCISCSVLFSIRNALQSARKDAGDDDVWFDIQPPFTGEKIWAGALTRRDMFYV